MKASGAPDSEFRTAFSGTHAARATGGAGTFGVDLDALEPASATALGGGRLLGSFADDGQAEATAFRLQSFRPDAGAAAVPDGVLTATVRAKASRSASTPAPARVAGEQAGAPVLPEPPAAMPVAGS